MDATLKTSIWKQYGAALDTLEDAIKLCPDDLWAATLWKDTEDARYGEFWFIVYHTLFWSDLYLDGHYATFTPPTPFKRRELPDVPYTKTVLTTYLHTCRDKIQATLDGLTDEQAYRVCVFEWIQAPYVEMQIYALRHAQEHAAQLNFFLGQQGVTGQDWIPQAKEQAS